MQNKFKLSVWFLIINGMLFLCPLIAESPIYLLDNNIRIEDRVIELEIPLAGVNFSIIWVTEDNRQWGKNHVSRMGTHFYEMRDHPEWKGKAAGIYISKFKKVHWNLKLLTTNEEFGIFIIPREISPSSICKRRGKTGTVKRAL